MRIINRPARLSASLFLPVNAALLLLLAFALSLSLTASAIPENLDAPQAQDAKKAQEAEKPQDIFQAGLFTIKFGQAGITSLKRTSDKYDTDYIQLNRELGHVRVVYKMGDNPWREFTTADPKEKRRTRAGVMDGSPQLIVFYNESGWDDYYADIEVSERFQIEGDALLWTIHVRNCTHKPLELGDVALPFPFNTDKRWEKTISYEQRVVQHDFISGHGSFIYWMRPNKEGPYLVLTPLTDCPIFETVKNERNFTPAKFEYQDRQGFYIHSKVTGEAAAAKGGNWRQPHTSVLLSPKYSPSDEITWGFKFRWAADEQGVRDVIAEEGLFDVNVIPGMTVPVDLEAQVALRTSLEKYTVEPEFPAQTKIEDLGEKAPGTRVFKVKFSKLGENLLRVKWGWSQVMILEFFVTEPIETLVKKRASFLVSHHQHRDPSKWYNGLFSEWDMKTKVLRSPDDKDGMLDYVLNCDDPGLCKAPYIAAKNVHYPVAAEIEAVEYYIKNFVWGGLQHTDREPYPYAVYGIDTWKKNRDSKPEDRDGWTGHVWRVYDYPHIIHLYLSMHRVAKHYPVLTKYLNARGYLERAFGTAIAYFTWPLKLASWSADDLGTMDECVINDVIDELDDAGMAAEAKRLRAEWERKIGHWVNDEPDVFYSEFPFDPTGFEAYGALVHYAMKELARPERERSIRVTREGVERFMREAIAGNTTTRGWLEPAFHSLGVEGNLRYMSQMGGWAILDHALYFAEDPAPYLRLGYASFLSSWCLMNTGTPETNYGYWWPGKENDGGAGSGFVSDAWGRSWIGKEQKRGAWQYSAEIDLGFGGALRTAATIVTDDPMFGMVALGGELARAQMRGQTQTQTQARTLARQEQTRMQGDDEAGKEVLREVGDEAGGKGGKEARKEIRKEGGNGGNEGGDAEVMNVIPRDGLRKRFHAVLGGRRLHVELDRDGFTRERPISVREDLGEIAFDLENRTSDAHEAVLELSGTAPGTYEVILNGKAVAKTSLDPLFEKRIRLPMRAKGDHRLVLRRT